MALKAMVLAAVRDSFRLFWMSLVKVRNGVESGGSQWRRRRHEVVLHGGLEAGPRHGF